MKLHAPFIITPRLMAGLHVGDAFISMGTGQRNAEGRTQYGCFIDLPDGTEHEVTDLRSGCQGGSLQSGFASLLSFLTACAESYSYAMRRNKPLSETENGDLFPPAVAEWAYQFSDELSMLGMEIKETKDLIEA